MAELDYPTPGSREAMAQAAAGRHPGTVHLMKLLAWSHLPPRLNLVSRPCGELAIMLVQQLGDGPELSAGLRKLREAKDCFVTQALEDLDRSLGTAPGGR